MLVALVAAVTPVVVQAPSMTGVASDKPNILLVLTDDQTLDEMSAMPFLQGRPDGHWVEFSSAHISTPLCCPSRATILSGQYSWRHNVLHNAAGHNLDDANTIATWLDAAGYRTGLFGKYLNTYPFDRGDTYIPPGWDTWAAFTGSEIGYQNYTLNENGTLVTYGAGPDDYSTDVLSERAVDFLGDGSPEPFFMVFAPYAPHAPATPPVRYQNTYDTVAVPRSPNINEEDVSDKPMWVQQLPQMTPTLEAARQSRIRRAYATVRAVDDAVEAMFESLRTNGELDNTVVIFLSDNGNSFWSHRHAGKQCAYEECINTPMLVRYPGTAQRTESALVSNLDLAPTIAELGGTAPTIPQDGRSLVPLLEGTAADWRQHLLLGVSSSNTIPDYWAIRTANMKYVELKTGEKELYDLVADPFELENRAGDPAYQETEAHLAYQLDDLNSLAITVAPEVIEADGATKATVSVTVLDAAGKPQLHEPLTVTSTGDINLGPVSHIGGGVYTSTVTASSTPGDEIITATLGPLSAAVVLRETADLAVTSISPASRSQDAPSVSVSVSGAGFGTGSTLSLGNGVKVKSTRVVSPNLITARISVAPRAAVGPRDVVVTRPDQASAACYGCFEVTASPSIRGVDPPSLPQGSAQEILVVGSGFTEGVKMTFGEGITSGAIVVHSADSLSVSLEVAADAAIGARTVTLTRLDGGTAQCTDCLSVVPP